MLKRCQKLRCWRITGIRWHPLTWRAIDIATASAHVCYTPGFGGKAMISLRRPMKSVVVRRSVRVADHKTCVSIENEFWEGLVEIAKERGVSPSELITSIDRDRREPNLSSAVRLFVLNHYRMQIAARRGRA
jgi:predicted DNA-binding ribbon-helix-helix protein